MGGLQLYFLSQSKINLDFIYLISRMKMIVHPELREGINVTLAEPWQLPPRTGPDGQAYSIY